MLYILVKYRLIFTILRKVKCKITHHTQPFYGSLDFVWDYPGESVPER